MAMTARSLVWGTRGEADVLAFGSRQIRRDLPDVAAGVGEAGRTHSPGPVHRAVEQLHSAPGQFRAYRIHVIDTDGELEA